MRRPAHRRVLIAVLALAGLLILSSAIKGTDPAGGAGATRTGPPGPEDVVVLNGRGYNYGPAPGRDLDPKRIEAQRAEAQRRSRP